MGDSGRGKTFTKGGERENRPPLGVEKSMLIFRKGRILLTIGVSEGLS